MPVNMTTYKKVLSNWQNMKSEWFNYIKEFELLFINLSTKKTLHQDSSPVNYHRTWRINNSNITQTLPGIEEKGKKYFSIMYEPSIILMPKPDKDVARKKNSRHIDAKIINNISLT